MFLIFPGRAPKPASHNVSQLEIKRVVLITIDTLRADHMGAYGYPRETSHASLFTSLHPLQHKILKNPLKPHPELEKKLLDKSKPGDISGYWLDTMKVSKSFFQSSDQMIEMINRYDAEILYTDIQIQRFAESPGIRAAIPLPSPLTKGKGTSD